MSRYNEEFNSLFDYLLEHDLIGRNDVFSLNFLKEIRFQKEKINLNQEQKEVLWDTFLKEQKGFNEFTPRIIFESEKCVQQALDIDIASLRYLENCCEHIQNYAISLLIQKHCLLEIDSPYFVKKSYEFVVHSISQDTNTVDYVVPEFFSEEQLDNFISIVLEKGYILRESSPEFLKKSLTLCLNSLRKDLKNIEFIHPEVKFADKIIKYLISQNYELSLDDLKKFQLQHLKDYEVMKYVFEKLDVYGHISLKYRQNFNRIFYDAVNHIPVIQDFEPLIKMLVDSDLEKKKSLGRQCDLLFEFIHKTTYFEDVKDFSLIKDLKETLNEKDYLRIYYAMKRYHEIYHFSLQNVELLSQYRTIIDELFQKYFILVCENTKDEITNQFQDELGEYFRLNLDNKRVYKRIKEESQKSAFANLYESRTEEIDIFVNDLVKKYKSNLSKEELEKIISYFIDEEFLLGYVEQPSRYVEYQIYTKVQKLLNLLYRGKLTFESHSIDSYRSFIKVIGRDLYRYDGPTFNENEIEEMFKYEKTIRLLEAIERDLRLFCQNLDVFQENLVDNQYMKKCFPFNDEYFKTDFNYLLNSFSVKDLLLSSIKDGGYGIESFTMNESCYHIYDFLVNHSGLWLLIMQKYNRRYSRSSIFSQNKMYPFDFIDELPATLNAGNALKIGASNYLELWNLHKLLMYTTIDTIALLGKENVKQIIRYAEELGLSESFVLEVAYESGCEQAKKIASTIPYVTGQTNKYKYSICGPMDILATVGSAYTHQPFLGERLQILLNYCIVHKNGFILKITDIYNNFIGYAAGLRNGNIIYIDHIETIYGKEQTNAVISGHIQDVIHSACNKMIEASQNNGQETIKLGLVFANRNEVVKGLVAPIFGKAYHDFSGGVMQTDNVDWQNFLDFAKGLSGCDAYYLKSHNLTKNTLNTKLIAESNKKKIWGGYHLNMKDLIPVYQCPRSKIIATTSLDSMFYQKINQILAVSAYFSGKNFNGVENISDTVSFIGQDWFIITKDWYIINSCVLDFDPRAQEEYQTFINIIENNRKKLSCKIDTNMLLLKEKN